MDSLCLVRPLASAIYGRVLLVRHRSSGRYYALKVMSLPHMRARRAVTGPYVQEDGQTELQILRTLGCNLVYSKDENTKEEHHECDVSSWSVSPVWNNGVEDDSRTMAGTQLGIHHLLTLHQDFVDWTTNTRCLLFDYCPYGDLFSHVGNPNGVTLEMARSWFGQIASAVRFLHARNVAHRDLSLENVLLDSFRRCRLADFGLASSAGSCCFGTRVGKILYMAPEVFSRSPCRPDTPANNAIFKPEDCYNGLQADIWSLGVILFILVTGIPPFEKAGDVDARFRLLSKPGGSVRDLFRAWGQENRLPLELRALLDRMLRVDPLQRPTADQVCDHEWLVEKNYSQKPTIATEDVPKQGEKRPVTEPEEEEDGENLEPQKMLSQRDKSWSCSSPRSNKRVKRME
ncbi:CAMK protein kinase [Phytophthora nicotianae]|uniref:CAMK protein kinase n=3 Tax=Phytophthora nicotianae TaxID=4792 RepID=V9EHT1_PHYNI|nr:CAMK protein kinase [Phytophthora nicotianae P1569]ETL85608.1 CAMK protein kinase [Phytophthora nicotianae]ETO67515.1 CAMK protein kinase [Phytophthora nicotianae P1976]